MAMIANVRGEVLFPVFFAFYFTINAIVSDAIWLNLPATGTKCVSEEIQNNVVVLADYVVVSDDHSHIPTISVKVCDFFFDFVVLDHFRLEFLFWKSFDFF